MQHKLRFFIFFIIHRVGLKAQNVDYQPFKFYNWFVIILISLQF